MKPTWTDNNRLSLLENGEAYFPRVFEVIAAARHEVIVETFILFDDPVGRDLHKALLSAADNGATVHLVVDGYGSPDLPIEFIRSLTEAGVHFHSWDPQPTLLGIRTNLFRRLHRKIVVVDQQRAFVGGINYAEDHLRRAGPQSKQDFAVELQGPVVEQIHGYCLEQLGRDPRSTPMSVLRRWVDGPRRWLARRRNAAAQVLFCVRDNDHHPRAIEEQYRRAIRAAREEVVLMNAYFFPSWSFLRDLRRAARRGVRVVVVVQGTPDKAYVKWAAASLYDMLLSAGVQIYEYSERPLHGKIAVIDGHWSTVGSSNLDPLSLALNLEANVCIRDRAFSGALRERVQELLRDCCRRVGRDQVPRQRGWRHLLRGVIYHLLRRFPAWSEGLGRRRQQLRQLMPGRAAAVDDKETPSAANEKPRRAA